MPIVSRPVNVWCDTCEEVRVAYPDTRKPDLIRCTRCGKDVAADPDKPAPVCTELGARMGRDSAPLWSETKFVFEEVIRREPAAEAPPSWEVESSRGKKAARRAEARRRRRYVREQGQ